LFTPNEVGHYTIDVEFNSRPIAGSPFDVEVVDPRKVLVNDEAADESGVFHLAVQQSNILDVDATAAGSGWTFACLQISRSSLKAVSAANCGCTGIPFFESDNLCPAFFV
uniref:Cadherin domain-containing protein n=1 Tax=Toxocara canis TaxID=6265 RepID=A0A183U8G9_TOXCA